MLTDKETHGLLKEYVKILPKEPKRLLEVGAYYGGFIEWIKANYPYETVCIDNQDFGCGALIIDQTDIKLKELGKFDIIIDDGCHYYKETKETFNILWDSLNSGGIYVIEDWMAGYWNEHPQYKGIENLIAELIINKKKLGIGNLNIILSEPKLSMAILWKE
jgi:hypothetical protein